MERLEDLRLFTLVAEARSFTRAAEKLNLSKSAASRRIAELEEQLGARLFHRTTRSISLTQVGQGFYQRISQILADLEDAERSVTDEHAAPRGVLKIAAPMSFGFRHLGGALCDFMSRYPEVEVDMELSDRFVDLVEEGYDLAVRIGRLKDSSLIARRICPARMVVCASPDYFKRRGRPGIPQDLTNHDCLIYTGSQRDEWTFRAKPGSNELVHIKVNGRIKANNGDVLRQAAAGGCGIVIMPTFIVGEDLTAGRLAPCLLDHMVEPSAVHCVYPANRHLSPKVRAFVDFMTGRFGPVPYWDESLTVLKGG
ncbi:LysR family transcriptional regulator [Indioceanicola profundi]|uniref:LysR family transcriptional regulator n=1 Tax=Indioceanicola profundi TaxID=2220096 RepID=UPI000E6AA375|nr:LysR family transcriptional regulator [Indioceanicola profundi]